MGNTNYEKTDPLERHSDWRWLGSLLLIGFCSYLLSCSDNDGGTSPPDPPVIQSSAPLLYDGSLYPAIGAFHITDLRSKEVTAAGNDTIDMYEQMEDYETRNLTVYHRSDKSDQPVVFFIHGGAWIDEYMEWYSFVPKSFTGAEGYVTVVINYRLTSDQVFPAEICPTRTSPAPAASLKAAYYPDNIRDCADAFRWVIDNIADYGGNPGQIFVFGHSAGGHLASLLTTHPDFADLRPSIKGVISLSGAYRLAEMNTFAFGSALEQTYRTSSDTAILDEASPFTYVTSDVDLPPWLILYAQDELPSLTADAIAFTARLQNMGQTVSDAHLTGYGHVTEMTAIEFEDEAPTILILEFIQAQLATLND